MKRLLTILALLSIAAVATSCDLVHEYKLAQYKKMSIEELIPLLAREDIDSQTLVYIKSAISSKGDSAIPYLEDLIRNGSWQTCDMAIDIISWKGPDGFPILLKALDEVSPDRRNWVAIRIYNLMRNHPSDTYISALPKFIQELEKAIEEGELGFRKSMVTAIEYIAEYNGAEAKEAVPVLIRSLERDERFEYDHRLHMFAPIEALGYIGPDASEALPKLRDLAENYPYEGGIREAAAETIKKIESPGRTGDTGNPGS